ncbi:hypothetical protein AAY473_015168 [Plecturocebus cupreus]
MSQFPPLCLYGSHWRSCRQYEWSYDTDSTENQLILKDKSITRSAADIRWKLQKLALEPEQSLESLLNQDREGAGKQKESLKASAGQCHPHPLRVFQH